MVVRRERTEGADVPALIDGGVDHGAFVDVPERLRLACERLIGFDFRPALEGLLRLQNAGGNQNGERDPEYEASCLSHSSSLFDSGAV